MKSIKIAYIVLKIYLAHFIIGLIIFGPNWIVDPVTPQDINQSATSEVLLIVAIVFYLFPLISMYETAVKRNSAQKRLADMISNAKVEVLSQEDFERMAAESGECDCPRCTEIRAQKAKSTGSGPVTK